VANQRVLYQIALTSKGFRLPNAAPVRQIEQKIYSIYNIRYLCYSVILSLFLYADQLYTVVMSSYDLTRQKYRPEAIKILFVAESPPPSADIQSSRHFYRSEQIRHDDRLFINTVKALYAELQDKTEAEIEPDKEHWLRRMQADGYYMIEALETSQRHSVTKAERQERIAEALPRLIERVKELANKDTKIILIKSNVFEVAAEPLRKAGFTVLNTELVDYPGQYNQRAYREKVSALLHGLS
jgi:hypothetical protein